MVAALESSDARNKLEDLSGITIKPGENPYNALIEACNDDPAQIQALYDAHRKRRNDQQKAKFLADDFKELIIDGYLLRLENPQIEPGFKDERYCMTFWGRPPMHVLELVEELQRRLKVVAPNLWLMPTYRMHITCLELAYSRTAPEIDALQRSLREQQQQPGSKDTTGTTTPLSTIANYTHTHHPRLIRPMISHDLSALAVSFLPASGTEPILSPLSSPADDDDDDDASVERKKNDDKYTYHHLRRDLWDMATQSTKIDSRYVVPSAHVTLGRFLTDVDHDTPEKRRKWVEAIDDINRWLEREVWDKEGEEEEEGSKKKEKEFMGEWIVGQEKGIDVRVGTLWYGGGRTVMMGEGF